MGLYGGYKGIMEKKMETTIMGFNHAYRRSLQAYHPLVTPQAPTFSPKPRPPFLL